CSRDLTCLHELLRNSGAINVPGNEYQRHAAHEGQQEDFEQLQLKIVEREQCYQLVKEFAELQRRLVIEDDDVAEIKVRPRTRILTCAAHHMRKRFLEEKLIFHVHSSQSRRLSRCRSNRTTGAAHDSRNIKSMESHKFPVITPIYGTIRRPRLS
ncbi:hypothetical protein DBV15_09509, partial [Temnothorax longispinosus]